MVGERKREREEKKGQSINNLKIESAFLVKPNKARNSIDAVNCQLMQEKSSLTDRKNSDASRCRQCRGGKRDKDWFYPKDKPILVYSHRWDTS